MEFETDEIQSLQLKNKPWQFQPGESGNPGGKPRGTKNKETIAEEIGEETLAKIKEMPKSELIDLIMRVSGAMWGVGIMNEEQTAEAMLLKIAINGLTSNDAKTTLENVNAWLDRKKGKAVQRIDQRVDQRVLSIHKGIPGEMTTSELLESLRSIKQLPEGMRLLGDGTIDIINEGEGIV